MSKGEDEATKNWNAGKHVGERSGLTCAVVVLRQEAADLFLRGDDNGAALVRGLIEKVKAKGAAVGIESLIS